MARPTKDGLDYFPLDVNLDEKFEYIEAVHGIVGFGVVLKLYQRIYRTGYLIPWTDKDVTLFASKIQGATKEHVEKIVADCLSEGIFSKEMFDVHKILTSSGIQKRYLHVTKRREKRTIEKDYCLVQISDSDGVSVDNNSHEDHISGCENGVSVLGIATKQSTAKDSKEQEREDHATRTSAQNEKELTEKDFLLRVDDKEYPLFVGRIKTLIAKHNRERTNGTFIWKATTGSLDGDLKSLAYKITDEMKQSLLWFAYKELGEKLNWPNYVEKCVEVMLKVSEKKVIHEPFKFVMYLLKTPATIVSEMADGSLSGALNEMSPATQRRSQ